MATHACLLAPVLSQPSAPFAVTAAQKRSIDCSPDDLAVVKQRCATEGLQVLGLRFTGDRLVPAERFEFLREHLRDAFVTVELDDDSANPAGLTKPHSVLTEHLVDQPGQPTRPANPTSQPGQPTRAALDQVLDLFHPAARHHRRQQLNVLP